MRALRRARRIAARKERLRMARRTKVPFHKPVEGTDQKWRCAECGYWIIWIDTDWGTYRKSKGHYRHAPYTFWDE